MNLGGGGSLQLGLGISNKQVDDGPVPPVARRGAELDAHKQEEAQINAPRGGNPNNQPKFEDFDVEFD